MDQRIFLPFQSMYICMALVWDGMGYESTFDDLWDCQWACGITGK